MRENNAVLITAMNRKELWYVAPPTTGREVTPQRIHSFKELPIGILEVEPDVFVVFTGNWYTTHESYAYKFDLRSWHEGDAVTPTLISQFPSEAQGLNGCCMLSPGTVLIADCFASLIWRMDFGAGLQSHV